MVIDSLSNSSHWVEELPPPALCRCVVNLSQPDYGKIQPRVHDVVRALEDHWFQMEVALYYHVVEGGQVQVTVMNDFFPDTNNEDKKKHFVVDVNEWDSTLQSCCDLKPAVCWYITAIMISTWVTLTLFSLSTPLGGV